MFVIYTFVIPTLKSQSPNHEQVTVYEFHERCTRPHGCSTVFFTAELMSTFSSTSNILLEGLRFSSAEKEQARTGKMNDINGQPILPGTRY